MAYNLMILDYLDHEKPYDSLLDEAFGTYFWTISSTPVTGAYDYLKSKGIDLITNDSLRAEISFFFESELLVLKNENEVWANNLQQNISYPFHVKHFQNTIRMMIPAQILNMQGLLIMTSFWKMCILKASMQRSSRTEDGTLTA